jgi:hypothetical protein
VYFSASGNILALTGNVFYGNTASYGGYPVVGSGTVSAASYNVVDKDFGTGTAQAGWAQGTGDVYRTSTPFASTATFAPVSDLQSVLPSTRPTDFPATDFYGNTRTFPGAPGAVAGNP